MVRFLPPYLSLLLKNKGFNEPCLASYKGDVLSLVTNPNKNKNSLDPTEVTAPTYDQVLEWFREKHKIHVAASSFPVYNDKYGYQFSRRGLTGGWMVDFSGKTYYDSLNTAIEQASNLIR